MLVYQRVNLDLLASHSRLFSEFGGSRSSNGEFEDVSLVPWRQRWDLCHHGSFHSHGGTPLSLDGLFHGKSPCKRVMTWGCPYFRKPPKCGKTERNQVPSDPLDFNQGPNGHGSTWCFVVLQQPGFLVGLRDRSMVWLRPSDPAMLWNPSNQLQQPLILATIAWFSMIFHDFPSFWPLVGDFHHDSIIEAAWILVRTPMRDLSGVVPLAESWWGSWWSSWSRCRCAVVSWRRTARQVGLPKNMVICDWNTIGCSQSSVMSLSKNRVPQKRF